MARSTQLVGDPDTWEFPVYVGCDSEARVRNLSRPFRDGRRAGERELAGLVSEQDTKSAEIYQPVDPVGTDNHGQRRHHHVEVKRLVRSLAPHRLRHREGVGVPYPEVDRSLSDRFADAIRGGTT